MYSLSLSIKRTPATVVVTETRQGLRRCGERRAVVMWASRRATRLVAVVTRLLSHHTRSIILALTLYIE